MKDIHIYMENRIFLVQCEDGQELYAAVYIMNEPYQSQPALPGKLYLEGILEGCRQNGLSENEIQKAVHTTRKEMKKQEKEKRVSWSGSGTIRIKEKE